LIFASAGSVTPNRQIDLSLRAFSEVYQTYPQARYLIVGEWQHPDLTLEELLAELNLREVVHHVGFVEDISEFDDWIASADVLVNLRHPTVGETSGVVLRALAAGRPVIVSNTGWYGELPEGSCLKVPPHDLPALTQAMLSLVQDVALRARMSQTASEYVRRVHRPAYVAAQYVEFVQESVARWRKPVLE
jgi:glycosyltransferase involved in cell wall biosynthesis